MYDGLMVYGPELWIVIDHIILIVIEVGVIYALGYHDGRKDRKLDRQRREK